MKRLNNYIQEKLIVNNTIQRYIYYPKTKDELIKCIREKIKKEGLGTKDKPLDLNDIDTSEITNMCAIFDTSGSGLTELSKDGNFDISHWNVSNVEDMSYMFYGSEFNGDLSQWDVSNVKTMRQMFCTSKFDGDISRWDVRNVEDMREMFKYSKFNGDLNNWKPNNIKRKNDIFYCCPVQQNKKWPKWHRLK